MYRYVIILFVILLNGLSVYADAIKMGAITKKFDALFLYVKDNHLGSVHAVVSDKRIWDDDNSNGIIDNGELQADVLFAADYYPMGGMLMPGRTFNPTVSRYKYQGQESDDEISGVGNVYAYKYRMSDARLGGQFWSIDPLVAKYPGHSPYSFSHRRVIDRVEFEGLEDAKYSLTSYDPVLKNATAEEIEIYQKAQTEAFIGGLLLFVGPEDLLLEAAAATKVGGAILKYADDLIEAGMKVLDKGVDLLKGADEIGEGVIYKRSDLSGNTKDYVGQSKSESRFQARQKEHARANPDSDFEFEIIDRGDAKGDFPTDLDIKEQRALDNMGGPTNKSNPDGGASNKKNVIIKQ